MLFFGPREAAPGRGQRGTRRVAAPYSSASTASPQLAMPYYGYGYPSSYGYASAYSYASPYSYAYASPYSYAYASPYSYGASPYSYGYGYSRYY